MPKIKVLIVEDEAIVAMDIRQRLEGLEYSVTAAVGNGQAALASIEKTPPDIILMDIMIQGPMDGIETAEKVRAHYDIPIIYLTANSDESTLQRAKTTGPLAYLLKPFEERELRTTIEIALYRHQLERKLKTNEQWLSIILKSIGDAVVVTDQDRRIRFMNAVAESLTRWPLDQAMDRDAGEVLRLRSYEGEAIESPIDKSLASGRIVECGNHVVLVTKGNDTIPIEDSAAPIKDDQGNVRGCVLVFRDVTERKKMERDLHNYRQYLEKLVSQRTDELTCTVDKLNQEIRENARIEREKTILRSLVENSPDCIGVTSTDGRIIYLNKTGRQVIGIDETETSSRLFYEYMPADQQAEFKAHIGTQVSEGGQWHGETMLLHQPDLGEIPAEMNAFLIHTTDADPMVGVGLIIRDITERKIAERDRRILQEQLQRADRMKAIGLLAGGIAHDLNNMLGPLVGYPDLLLRKIKPDSSVRKMIEQMGKAAGEAAEVVQDMLTLARQGKYDLVPVNLNHIIAEYLDSPAYADIKKSYPNVSLQCRLDDSIQSVKGSAIHLKKALMNLILNAYEAMQENGGTLTLETSCHYIECLRSGYSKIEPGNHVIVRIADSGKGISPDDLPCIFEPYFSRKQMTRSGSGLGLSIVYGIIKDHRGYYDVNSEVGRGTEFILYFPAVTELPEIDRSPEAIEGGTGRILIVDDDKDQRELATDLLSSLGYEVTAVEHGHAAIEYLKDSSVDIVILDMIMESNFDGLDTYREILKIHPGQRAIVVSGFSQTERVKELCTLGVGAYLRKPYSLTQLAQAVRSQVNNRSAITR